MTACKLPLRLLLLIALLSSLAQSQIPYEVPSRDAIMNTDGGPEGAPRYGPPKKPKLSKEAKAALAPPDDLKLAYKDFLKQKNTGLIRLLQRKEKKERMMVSADNPTAYIPFRDGGSSYSFSTRKYGDWLVAPEILLDISMGKSPPGKAFWATTGGAGFGFITKLGDVALEEVTLDRKEAKFLVDLKAPNREPAAREYQRMCSSGFEVNGVFYRRWVPAEKDTTYLLRTIAYDSGDGITMYYNGADLIVAFRTVREEPDGSYVILWKIMKKNPIPFFKKKRVLYNPFPR